ncbi:NlpC/P60 family protein, partial [Streptomyces sp. ventii]|nr:NlpC/P60 family protein [Streptomyces spiramenti]
MRWHAPRDLVFYYPGLTHVGMYVGNGQIIHASRPGTPVRY